MGIMRKLTSVSTLGAVKYTSRREAQTKAASAQAREARAETKLLKEQTRQVKAGTKQATAGTNAAKPSFREITDAGKMQRAARRSGVKMTLDECIAAVREVNRAEDPLMTSGAGRGG